MELLQDGYLTAVVAAAGCTMAKPCPDDGIDWVVTHALAGGAGLNVQLAGLDLDVEQGEPDSEDASDDDADDDDADDDDDDDDDEVDLKVQLKATAKCGPNPKSGVVAVSLRNARFRLLARKNPTVHRILVAMIMPRKANGWLSASHSDLRIHHCAYWINMQGMEPAAGQKSTTVHVPTSQVFDDGSLCQIMQRIRHGGRP